MLAVGPGGVDKEGKRIEMSVAPGDKVLIPPVGPPHPLGKKITGAVLLIDINHSTVGVKSRLVMRSIPSLGTMSKPPYLILSCICAWMEG